MNLELIAFLAGLISSTAAIPQIISMWRTKKTRGVSVFMFSMKNVSNSLWVIFGIYSGTYSMIFWNVISLTLCTAVIIMKYKILRDKERAKAMAAQGGNIIAMPVVYKVVDNTINDAITAYEPKRPHLKLAYSRPQTGGMEMLQTSASSQSPQA